MGVDYYTCDLCEECVNENYISCINDTCCNNDEYSNIFNRLKIEKQYVECYHRLCNYCMPQEFKDICIDKINDDNITIDVLNNPWKYCKLCKEQKDKENEKNEILTKINSENIDIDYLKAIIIKLLN